MKHALLFRLLSCLVLLPAASAWAQAPLTTSPYTQNFNALPITGLVNEKSTLPTGWDFNEVGTGNNATYAADNGSLNSGNTYSYGAAESTERALGSLQSGSVTSTLGASFQNTTGATITSLTITYQGETWRVGGTNRADRLDFQYSLTATSLATADGWQDVNELDYSNPSSAATVVTGVAAPIHSATVTATINTLNIAPGTTFWIRWTDFNAAGADDGTAIDDFSLTFNNTTPASPTLSVTPASLSFDRQAVNTNSAPQSYTLTGTSLTADVTATAPAGFALSKSDAPTATFTPTLTFTPAELATAQTVYVRFSPTTGGANSGNITHTSTGAEARNVAVSGTGIDPNDNLFSFDVCPSNATSFDTWTAFSVTGPQTWACTTFGRAANDPTNRASAPNGLQINGFVSNAGVENEDWLISPAFDLSAFQFPIFSFWSRVRFAGPALRLRVSTNYSGTGNPTAAGVTWTDLNADFPGSNSDIWTQTSNIDLTRFKGANVYLAFVYTSGPEAGAARWTLDDLRLQNATAAPAPVLLLSSASLAFGYQAANTTAQQTLTATFRNLTGPVTIASSDATFQLSKDGTTFSNSLTYTVEEANFTTSTVTARFAPTQAARAYSATVTASTAGTTNAVATVTGNTYAPENTLDVVSWNIEWFGATGQGPSNENLQQANALAVLTALNADVYGLIEVVDTARLGAVVRQLPGGYKYRVAEFASGAPDATSANFASAQKLIFVYRTSVVSNPTFSGLLRCPGNATTCPQYNAWASGRFPYLMEADVTINGRVQRINFVLIHGKANENTSVADAQEAYDRRKLGADALKAELDTRFGTGNVLILGDFNDDLDQTVASGVSTTATSFSAFTTDAANYVALTLPLSQAGLRSTVGFGDVIDHAVASSELNAFYVPNTAQIRTDLAAQITDYANTTSDHYPILTRFNVGTVTSTSSAWQASAQLEVYPNPTAKTVQLRLPATAGSSVRLQVTGTDGRVISQAVGSLEQVNQQLNQQLSTMRAGVYILRVTSADQTYVKRVVKQ